MVIACRAVDLPILRLAVSSLRRFTACREIHVFTARSSLSKFRRVLGDRVRLHNEDQAIPGMTLAELKRLNLPGFPKAAGWYFQQLLKYSYASQNESDDYYLIWDADTIPLRPLEFFDSEGRMLFTVAEEKHQSYFSNYQRLLRETPVREFSFIAQHIIVQKSILRRLLGQIEMVHPGGESWAWKIMRNLEGTDTNLFSEYETYGHFVKAHYPERAVFLRRAWLRDGSQRLLRLPRAKDLQRLSAEYDFVSFESRHRPLRKAWRSLRDWWAKMALHPFRTAGR